MARLRRRSAGPVPRGPSVRQTAEIPLSIVAPCHRVVGATGALTGFAGGLDVKERLLKFEKAKRPYVASGL
jgi:hypothetical protein